MIAVVADENEIRVNIPTAGMTAETVRTFVDWLRLEATARRSRLTDEKAWALAEDVKSDWWARNESRLPNDRLE